MRNLLRTAKTPESLKIRAGKRKAYQTLKFKLIHWPPALDSAVDEALKPQKTSSILIFGNTSGKIYTRGGWTTVWNRLMGYYKELSKGDGVDFTRFALRDMRPMSVTERVTAGVTNIINATGHVDKRMIRKTYDRNAIRKPPSTK